MTEERERTLLANEAVYRELNEQLEHMTAATAELMICCECANMNCARPLRIEYGEYERVRADALLFVIAPGHDDVSVEDVVERGSEYHVVRKRPSSATVIAEQTHRKLDAGT